jgi:hypothetical protein
MSRVDEISGLRKEVRCEVNAIEKAAFADFLMSDSGSPWPVIKLADILLGSEYGTSKPASPVGDGVPVLRMGNMAS